MDKSSMVYKMRHGLLDYIQWRDFFQMSYTFEDTPNLSNSTFSQRVVNMYNELPADVAALIMGVQKNNSMFTIKLCLGGRQSN